MAVWIKCMAKRLPQSKGKCQECKEILKGSLIFQGLPGALFVIDSHNEVIAIAEANRLKHTCYCSCR